MQRQARALLRLGWEIKVISPLPWFPISNKFLTMGRWLTTTNYLDIQSIME